MKPSRVNSFLEKNTDRISSVIETETDKGYALSFDTESAHWIAFWIMNSNSRYSFAFAYRISNDTSVSKLNTREFFSLDGQATGKNDVIVINSSN